MSAPIRRLVVVASRYPFGSQEAYLTGELEQLVRHFERVAVVPVRPARGAAQHRVPDGVEVVPWPLVSPQLAGRALRAFGRKPLACGAALTRLFASRDPGKLRNAAVALKALALGAWAKERGYEHFHAYWLSTPATVAMLAATASDATWSATAHRWDIYERNAFDVKAPRVAFVRAISGRGEGDLRVRMPNLNGRLQCIRLGVALPDRPPAFDRPGRTEFRIACPAALVPVKGHDVLLAALAKLKDRGVSVRCSLFGDGPLRERLEGVVRQLRLEDAVRFEGFVAQERLHEAYRSRRFDAVVMASRSAGEKMMEGMPSAVLEAMAFGVPVVSTRSGSIDELIDESCGILVAPDDSGALAAALFSVYHDPDAARARAERAYEIVSERHDVRARVRELAHAIQLRG